MRWDQELHYVGHVSRRERFGSLREGAIVVRPLRPAQKCEGLADVLGMQLRIRKILLATHIAAESARSMPRSAGRSRGTRTAAPPRRAFDVSASYMPSRPGEEIADQYRTTLQWSRRAIGLKLFMCLAERGRSGLAERIDHQARIGDTLRAKLKDAGWIVVNDTTLPLVCITHEDIQSSRCTTDDIVRSIQARGLVWLSDVVLGNREKVLRACITSFRTNENDLDILISELERARHEHRKTRELP
jgi:hypothetical protein